jgi:hypothetical protein
MEEDGIFYGHLFYGLTVLWTFGTIGGNLVYFSRFWYFVQREIWQPCSVGTNAPMFGT